MEQTKTGFGKQASNIAYTCFLLARKTCVQVFDILQNTLKVWLLTYDSF